MTQTQFVNGDFESGDFTGWSVYAGGHGTPTANEISTAEKHSGTRSWHVKIDCASGAYFGGYYYEHTIQLYQPIDWSKIDHFTFWVKVVSSTQNPYAFLQVMLGGNGSYYQDGSVKDWTQVSIDTHTLTNQTLYFRITDYAYSTGPGESQIELYLDDFVCYPRIPIPVSDFTANPTTGKVPLSVQFTDASTGTIDTRAWTFGDGGTDNVQNPAHTYSTPGFYTPTLTDTNETGSNQMSKSNYINALPADTGTPSISLNKKRIGTGTPNVDIVI